MTRRRKSRNLTEEMQRKADAEIRCVLFDELMDILDAEVDRKERALVVREELKRRKKALVPEPTTEKRRKEQERISRAVKRRLRKKGEKEGLRSCLGADDIREE